MTPVPYRNVRVGPSDVVLDHKPDGTILVRSPHALGKYPKKMTELLDHWARHASYRTFLAQREPRFGWRNITYAETQFFARRIGQALLNRGLSVQNPVVVLSGNEIEHALLEVGCMYAGIPYCPVSPAYSLASTDFKELHSVFKLLTPGLVYASDGVQYEKAIRAVVPADTEVVVNVNPIPGATNFGELVNVEVDSSLEGAHARVHADTVLKILFTGLSSEPRAVINTQRMWASNQEMLRSYLPFLADEPPILVSWLPWSGVFGGNSDLGMVIYNGGSLYIDQGQPEPSLFDKTVHTLRRIAPTMYGSNPNSYELLIPHLRADAAFRKHFFSRLKLLYYVDGGPSEAEWNELQKLAVEECGECIPMLTGLGLAETAPHALIGVKYSGQPELVGTPPPGVELKLIPLGKGRFEARFRGPNVTPGYWRRLDVTRSAFDEDGFLKTGLNLRFVDEADPAKGFMFEGVTF